MFSAYVMSVSMTTLDVISCQAMPLTSYSFAASTNKSFYREGDSMPIAGYSYTSLWLPLGVWKGWEFVSSDFFPFNFPYLGLILEPFCFRGISIIGGHYFFTLILTSRRMYHVETISFCPMISPATLAPSRSKKFYKY